MSWVNLSIIYLLEIELVRKLWMTEMNFYSLIFKTSIFFVSLNVGSIDKKLYLVKKDTGSTIVNIKLIFRFIYGLITLLVS